MLLPVTAESVGICHEVCGKRPEETLGGGFKYCLCSSLFGEMMQFDEHIFQMGWNHQLVLYLKKSLLNKNPQNQAKIEVCFSSHELFGFIWKNTKSVYEID